MPISESTAYTTPDTTHLQVKTRLVTYDVKVKKYRQSLVQNAEIRPKIAMVPKIVDMVPKSAKGVAHTMFANNRT